MELESKVKICKNKTCKQDNPQLLCFFNKDKLRKDGLNGYCKICTREVDKKSRSRPANKIKKKLSKRKFDLRKYNLTIEKYKEMLIEQNYKCKICEIEEVNAGKLGLVVDHSHKNNLVRSLLCNSCNTLLGYAKEKIEILDKAKEYLKFHEINNG